MNYVGRAVISKKLLADEVHGLDILHLSKKGVFKSGPNMRWTSRWRCRNRESGSIGYYLIEDFDGNPIALRFIYTVPNNHSGQKESFDYQVFLDATPCHFGGQRWWFICPLRSRRNCLHRSRIIYLTPYNSYFGCRECCELSYECRQQHRNHHHEYWKHVKRMEAAQKLLFRCRSSKKKKKAQREIEIASREIERFDAWLNAQMMRLETQVKK